jgi:hypothetical protein
MHSTENRIINQIKRENKDFSLFLLKVNSVEIIEIKPVIKSEIK